MRLQATGGGTFHLFAYLAHAHHVHHLVGKGALFEQRLQMLVVERLVHDAGEPRPHIGAVAVANGLDDQVAQRTIIK